MTGLVVPAAARVLSARELRALAEVAERERLGWNANDMSLDEEVLFFLLPYSYEAQPMPLWKCRVIAVSGGLPVEIGEGKRIRFGRLDVSLTTFRRLPVASRKAERQLLHWLAWEAAVASWRSVDEDR
ncbi:hypothetical protein [Actinoplanes sp. NPDC049118]|uniref:hypothetical protein n=1 Tax=Actinoplanes sp. NPDC049118 TaxID=3155769 RepID=UPI0033E2FA1A